MKNQGTVVLTHIFLYRHPESEAVLEELWLYEAITETYIPFLQMCEQLLAEGIEFRYTVSVTPTLAHMLDDALLRARYSAIWNGCWSWRRKKWCEPVGNRSIMP